MVFISKVVEKRLQYYKLAGKIPELVHLNPADKETIASELPTWFKVKYGEETNQIDGTRINWTDLIEVGDVVYT